MKLQEGGRSMTGTSRYFTGGRSATPSSRLTIKSRFAHSAAYGGIIAAIVALLALILLPSASGVVIAWIFNIWGTADLFNAFYQANHAGLMAGQLGATYFIPTFIVPLLLITHGLGFWMARYPLCKSSEDRVQIPS
jgi:hypothetical protein